MSNIFLAKAPYRVSLLGGGSDLDWFVNQNGYGYSLGYSLDLSSTISLHPLPDTASRGILNYSTREYYSSNSQVIHPLIRSAFGRFQNLPFFELSSYGVASGGSGLGGSSSFLVALLGVLSLYTEQPFSPFEIAAQASNIEINDLSLPIGRQDQFTSALGGFSCLKFLPGGVVEQLRLSEHHLKALYRLVDTLILIPTKITRPADKVLSQLRGDPMSVSQFSEIRSLAEIFITNQSNNPTLLLQTLHELISESWKIKRKMSGVMTNDLDKFYQLISNSLPNNWVRLIGAGRGGYFLVSLKISREAAFRILNELKIFDSFPAAISEEGLVTNVF